MESIALAGQRETTCHKEKERVDTDLEFSSWVSVVVLTCLSAAGFIFIDSPLVCDTPFRSPSPNGARKFSSIFVASIQLLAMSSHKLLQTKSSPYFRIVSEGGGTISFPVVPHRSKRFGSSGFFKSFLINVVTHPRLADPQMPWPTSLRGQLSAPVDSVCPFFLFLLYHGRKRYTVKQSQLFINPSGTVRLVL